MSLRSDNSVSAQSLSGPRNQTSIGTANPIFGRSTSARGT